MREGIDEAVAVVVRGLRQIDPETWKGAARPGVRFTPQQRGALAGLADDPVNRYGIGEKIKAELRRADA